MPLPSPRRFSAGRLFYLLYHRPRTWFEDRRDQAAGRRGEAAMRPAAATLPPLKLPDRGLAGPPCRFLTGAALIHQTIFCARSFEWACGSQLRLEVFSDGTLDCTAFAQLRRALPHAILVDPAAVEARLDKSLPMDRFPLLRQMRDSDPRMRKLLDLHAGLEGPSLYLDSDMLFFSEPRTLRDWLHRSDGELYMHQNGDALVGERTNLARTFGFEILEGVNSGIVAVRDEAFDWSGLERTAGRMTAEELRHPWAEQTLFACHLSQQGARPLSSTDYAICHGWESLGSCPPSLRHYVNKAKTRYLAVEWRRWLEHSGITPPRFT